MTGRASVGAGEGGGLTGRRVWGDGDEHCMWGMEGGRRLVCGCTLGADDLHQVWFVGLITPTIASLMITPTGLQKGWVVAHP